MSASKRERLHGLPTMGWVSDPSPVRPLHELGDELGLGSLFVKEDDRIPKLGGGNKVRKLDYLLAQEPYASAKVLHGTGTLASSQLLVGARAAHALGREFSAHICYQRPTEQVLEFLAHTACLSSSMRFYKSRAKLFARAPHLFALKGALGHAFLPPGGTTAAGNCGFVRAGLELAEQIEAGLLPCPDRIYLPLGTGGTAVGLALGLTLAKLPIEVRAIAVVERVFASQLRLRQLAHETASWLREKAGIEISLESMRLELDNDFLGRAYAEPSAAGAAAMYRLRDENIQLDPTYTAKAMSGLLRHAPDLGGKNLLFWQTLPAPLGEPPCRNWKERLPEPLLRRLRREGAID